MGQLTSALAHELNQPLGAILRNAEAAEIFLQNEKPDLEEIRAILADIRKDDQRAGNVIEPDAFAAEAPQPRIEIVGSRRAAGGNGLAGAVRMRARGRSA